MRTSLSIEEINRIAKKTETGSKVACSEVSELVTTIQNNGRNAVDFERRLLSARILANIAKSEPSKVASHADGIAKGLELAISRKLGRTDIAFSTEYAKPNSKAGYALTETLGQLARVNSEWVSPYADVLLLYLSKGDGEIDETLVALEAIASRRPNALDPALLVQCLENTDPFKQAAAARVVGKLAPSNHISKVLDGVDLSMLEVPLKHDDHDICGATVRVLGDLAEYGHAEAVLSDVRIEWFEHALTHSESHASKNATGSLCEIAAAGYTETIARGLDLSLLNKPLKHNHPDVIGNTLILIQYIAEYDHGYSSQLVDCLDLDQFEDYLTHNSLFVRRNAATALGYLAESEHVDVVVDTVSVSNLEPLIAHADGDVSGNAVATLNELIDGGYAATVVDEIDVGVLEAPLRNGNAFACGNAASTIGYLAEQGFGDVIIEAIDVSLLNSLLIHKEERVRLCAAASLSDLAENGFAYTVMEHITLSYIEPLFDGTDPDEVINAILLVGRLAEQGYAEEISFSVDLQKFGSLLTHDNPSINENAALALGVFILNGITEPILKLVPEIIEQIQAMNNSDRKAPMWTLACLLQFTPDRTAEVVPQSDTLDVLLTAAEETDIDYQMENDDGSLTLRTRIAMACKSFATTRPVETKTHSERIRNLLDAEPYVITADDGRGAVAIVSALAYLGTTGSVPSIVSIE